MNRREWKPWPGDFVIKFSGLKFCCVEESSTAARLQREGRPSLMLLELEKITDESGDRKWSPELIRAMHNAKKHLGARVRRVTKL